MMQRFFASASSLYNPAFLPALVQLLEVCRYRVYGYLRTFWNTQDFADMVGKRPTPTDYNRNLVVTLMAGAAIECTLGVGLMLRALVTGSSGWITVGIALIVAYPIVWAHLLALIHGVIKLGNALQNPKMAARNFVCDVLEWQVVRLRKTHKFIVVAVAGSVGKTSTKLAIAHTLEATRRVIYQTGNYNDRVTVPLVLFGRKLPSLLNAFAWAKVFMANERSIRRPFYYDIAVVELGTDAPGQMAKFAYLEPELTVVTAATPEHMVNFHSMDAVAIEELSVVDYSDEVLVNADDAPEEYLNRHQLLRYGLQSPHNDCYASNYKPAGLADGTVDLRLADGMKLQACTTILGVQGVKILLAAAAAAQRVGLSKADIEKGLQDVRPFAGRMQLLKGIKNSTLIDDTYNASPIAVKAGMDVLYSVEAPQRIAILGSMNELGKFSPEAHCEIGEYCVPAKLDLVVTIGRDAKKYLAPLATERGCTVVTTDNPYEAGAVVKKHLKTGAVVLAEGSQNLVYAEEALKLLLADRHDARKLVRQSDDWLQTKRQQFPQATELNG